MPTGRSAAPARHAIRQLKTALDALPDSDDILALGRCGGDELPASAPDIERVAACRQLGDQLDAKGLAEREDAPNLRKLLIAIFSWVAEQEIANLRKRVHAFRRRVLAAGGVCNQVCFGLRIEHKDGIPTAVLDEAARPALVDLAKMIGEGMSRRSIAERWTARKVGGRAAWDHKTVKLILTDERLRASGVWSQEQIDQIDATLAAAKVPVAASACAQVHLASRYLECGVCGGALTVKKNGSGYASYVCGTCTRSGIAACAGIGYRPKHEVERALIEMTRAAISGPVFRRAREIARRMMEATPDVASEREAVEVALAKAEAEGKRLAKMARTVKDEDAEDLTVEIQTNAQEKRTLRSRLARLEAAPALLDKRRRLAAVEKRLAELETGLDQGGMAAAPAVAAVLQGARISVVPVVVDGVRRWELSGWIPSGYLLGITQCTDGDLGSGRAPPEPYRSSSPA